MTSSKALTMGNVTQWIDGLDDRGVTEMLTALQGRHDALHAERALGAVQGEHVVISDVSPRYLEGLEGVIEEMHNTKVSIRLTPESTGHLRFGNQRRYAVGADMRFLLHGVPASCCFTPETLAALA